VREGTEAGNKVNGRRSERGGAGEGGVERGTRVVRQGGAGIGMGSKRGLEGGGVL